MNILFPLILTSIAGIAPEEPARLSVTPTTQPILSATTGPVELVVPPAQIIDHFMQSLSVRETVNAKALQFIRDSKQKHAGDDSKDFINFALAVINADFKRAMDLRDADRPIEAAEAFEKLSATDDPYVSVNAAVLAASDLLERDELVRCLKMLRSVQNAHAPIDRYTLSPERFEFALGYCLVHNLEYAPAMSALEGFLRKYPQAPERLRVAAAQIVTELSRRMPGQLGDVRDLLAFARRQIRLGDTSDRVVQRQGEAVALLDELIKDAEEQEKSQGSAGESKGGKSKGGAGGAQPGGGSKQSQLLRGQTTETRLRRTQAKPGEAWGRMPPKEREAILQSMQRQFPGRYRELLEQYYKELAKESPTP